MKQMAASMLSSGLSNTITPCFQFKANFSSCIVFEILRYDLDEIKASLTELTAQTPHFFSGSPVVIDLEKTSILSVQDVVQLKQFLQSHGMVPVGIRGGSRAQQARLLEAGLPPVRLGKMEGKYFQPAEKPSTMLVTRPVRSGMQVYAEHTDLIVTTSVSPGAELMAYGHIHVYGCLRGKALAGVHGDETARIFCCSLDAELVAIAGRYLTRDDIPVLRKDGNMIQIFLRDETLHIETVK